MLYLSAQPDEPYFIWQLELQLFNFYKLKLAPEKIQVLIGYNKITGLNPDFKKFIKNNKTAHFFIYPDTRAITFYPSSLRPHIIKKHFEAHPKLCNEAIFYHDSDIIFRTLPNFDEMLLGKTWHLSNTKSYLDSYYLKAKGEGLFENMCSIIGISPQTVINNDNSAGGAQYLLKNTNYNFWDKVEQDSVKLYFILNIYQQLHDKIIDLNPKSDTPIQAWCADMWAILWNAWTFGHKTLINRELDFCWPQDPINRWNETKIYHDAGVLKNQVDRYFCKSLYKSISPFGDNFDYVLKSSCSYRYIENMQSFLSERII